MAEAPKIPQIVRERLRVQAGVPVSVEHPDADLLTAFAENILAAHERSQVLDHLAVCSSCREIVILSQPATAETGEVAPFPAARTRNWMTFRWAALAACLVLTVGVVLLERSSRLSPAENLAPPPAASITSGAVNDNLQAKMEPEPATNLGLRNEKPAEKKRAREKRDRTQSARGDVAFGYADMKSNSIGRPYDGSKDYYSASGTIGRLGKQAATKEEDSSAAAGLVFGGTAEVTRSAPAPGASGGTQGGPVAKAWPNAPSEARGKVSKATSSSGVAGARVGTDLFTLQERAESSHPAAEEPGKKKVADEPLVPPTPASSRQRVLARDDRRAVAQSLAMSANNFNFEAKDQPETLTSSDEKLEAAYPAPMQWRIRGGKLQRSNDDGKTWQEVNIPTEASLRAFWSSGNSVWAGGTEGSLFRITEAGKNSVRIPIKIGEGDVSLTVVAVTFSDELHGIITLENGQILQTADGGKTWVRH